MGNSSEKYEEIDNEINAAMLSTGHLVCSLQLCNATP